MTKRWFVGGAVLAGALFLLATSVPGQTGYKAPRTGDGKPNLNGIWQAMTSAHWDVEAHPAAAGPMWELGAQFAIQGGAGIVEGGQIPYTPEALKKKQENFANRTKLDPEAKCYMPGVPRAMYMPYPFQIIQGTNKIVIAYAFANAGRLIHMDKVGESPADTWMGWSQGRWEGDTLVVDVTSLIDQTWFDRAGNFHSEALHVIERYTASGANFIQYEATIEDPKVFTRPWKMSLT